ncbi:MAG: ABC transporter permease [Gammaproteobacteria bacterium]|nr:ABC transporter permease [Gammaproteobacteria bacterium]
MLPRLEPRGQASQAMVYLTPFIALFLTVIAGMVMFALLGHPPVKAITTFFLSPLNSGYGIAELFVKATPLIMIAVGLAIGFRANVWNIGAEGQLTLGAIAGSFLPVYFSDSENALMLPAMMLMGIAGGMAWAAIPALLKTRFNANEILTSLMLTYVATLFLSVLVHGPWRDPGGFNFPESVLFADVATLPILLSGTRLHLGALIALFVVLIGWILLARHLIGFQIKVAGFAPAAAEYAGFKRNRVVWLVLLGAGGLAGLAGIIEVSGPIGQLLPSISPGYGFTAIIVAFLGRLHPVGILFAGLVLALSYLGGETVQIEMGLPQGIAGVFQGMLLFFLLATDVLIKYRIRFGQPRVVTAPGT